MPSVVEAAQKVHGPLLSSGVPEHCRVGAQGLSAGQDTAACHIQFLCKHHSGELFLPSHRCWLCVSSGAVINRPEARQKNEPKQQQNGAEQR